MSQEIIQTLIDNAKKDINDILYDLERNISIMLGRPVPMSKSDKNRIIDMYKKGASTDEVLKIFNKYTLNQVAAIKAHCTMNTYL